MGEDMAARYTHLGEQVPLAWVRLLAVHSRLAKPMDQHLRDRHGLTINDYEVLLRLSWASDGPMTRGQIADSVHLTYGGVTRLLAGLERAGLVATSRSRHDRRIAYAELTDAGRQRFGEAVRTHVSDIRELFQARLSDAALAELAELLGRLIAEPTDCTEDTRTSR